MRNRAVSPSKTKQENTIYAGDGLDVVIPHAGKANVKGFIGGVKEKTVGSVGKITGKLKGVTNKYRSAKKGLVEKTEKKYRSTKRNKKVARFLSITSNYSSGYEEYYPLPLGWVSILVKAPLIIGVLFTSLGLLLLPTGSYGVATLISGLLLLSFSSFAGYLLRKDRLDWFVHFMFSVSAVATAFATAMFAYLSLTSENGITFLVNFLIMISMGVGTLLNPEFQGWFQRSFCSKKYVPCGVMIKGEKNVDHYFRKFLMVSLLIESLDAVEQNMVDSFVSNITRFTGAIPVLGTTVNLLVNILVSMLVSVPLSVFMDSLQTAIAVFFFGGAGLWYVLEIVLPFPPLADAIPVFTLMYFTMKYFYPKRREIPEILGQVDDRQMSDIFEEFSSNDLDEQLVEITDY